MYQSLLKDEEILAFLLRCDRERAAELRSQGCGCCRGRLHRADYLRKPRGLGLELDPDLATRLSFCCAAEGCRKRSTPPSLRFLGRKVYLSVAVVLDGVLASALAAMVAHELRAKSILAGGTGPFRDADRPGRSARHPARARRRTTRRSGEGTAGFPRADHDHRAFAGAGFLMALRHTQKMRPSALKGTG